MLPKTSGFVKCYEGQTKWMYFFIEGDSLLRKYNTTWDKVSADIKKEFDNKTVYKKQYLKAKIKLHDAEVAVFYDNEIPMVDSNHSSLAVISLDFIIKNGGRLSAMIFKRV